MDIFATIVKVRNITLSINADKGSDMNVKINDEVKYID